MDTSALCDLGNHQPVMAMVSMYLVTGGGNNVVSTAKQLIARGISLT